MKFMISGGGTGGHIFPAVAIADELKRRYPKAKILFVGAYGRMEMEKVPAAGYEIVGLPVRGLDRKRLWRNGKVLLDFIHSYRLARKSVKEFRPDVVIGVGGYASAPTLRAAQRLGVPTLIQEQNSYAGVSNKFLAKAAKRICVAYPSMHRFFPEDKIVHTGNPIRPDIEALQENLCDKAEAEAYFGFAPDDAPTLFVMGGSLGARTINMAVAEGLPELAKAGVRLIWQTGVAFADKARELAAKQPDLKAYVSPFIQRMDLAYSLASVVVSRAGALSLSEISLIGLPAVLVPSPNVAEDHQTKNALSLSSRGAAVLVRDVDAVHLLIQEALELLKSPEKLASIKEHLKAFAAPKAAAKIADEVETLIRMKA